MNFKNVKSFLVVILISITCLGTFLGCNPKESPSEVVTKALTATKSLDEASMKNYFTYEELMNFDKANKDKDASKKALEDKETAKLLFSKLNFKVLSSSTDKDTATVKTEITNLDMKSIIGEYFAEAMKLAMGNAFLSSDKQLSDDEMSKKAEQMFKDIISKPDNKTVTATVDVKLEKVDKKWKIKMDEKFQDAITGGLVTVMNSMKDSTQSENTPKNKIAEIRNYIVSDIWNKGFCDIDHYMGDGKSSTGESIDIDFTLAQLDTAYKKKADYDKYIQGLDTTKFADIKNIWSKLSAESDVLYNKIKSNKPTANGGTLDTGKFTQYMDAFQQAVDSVK